MRIRQFILPLYFFCAFSLAAMPASARPLPNTLTLQLKAVPFECAPRLTAPDPQCEALRPDIDHLKRLVEQLRLIANPDDLYLLFLEEELDQKILEYENCKRENQVPIDPRLNPPSIDNMC